MVGKFALSTNMAKKLSLYHSLLSFPSISSLHLPVSPLPRSLYLPTHHHNTNLPSPASPPRNTSTHLNTDANTRALEKCGGVEKCITLLPRAVRCSVLLWWSCVSMPSLSRLAMAAETRRRDGTLIPSAKTLRTLSSPQCAWGDGRNGVRGRGESDEGNG